MFILDDFVETVGGQVSVEHNKTNPLTVVQNESISRMRNALLSLSIEDSTSVKTTIQQITVLRIYHQLGRIVKYLDIMDRLEDKLYESIDAQLMTMEVYDSTTMQELLLVQASLQKSMIESHKLLQPYLEIENLSIGELMPDTTTDAKTSIIPETSREKLRIAAQTLLSELDVDSDE